VNYVVVVGGTEIKNALVDFDLNVVATKNIRTPKSDTIGCAMLAFDLVKAGK